MVLCNIHQEIFDSDIPLPEKYKQISRHPDAVERTEGLHKLVYSTLSEEWDARIHKRLIENYDVDEGRYWTTYQSNDGKVAIRLGENVVCDSRNGLSRIQLSVDGDPGLPYSKYRVRLWNGEVHGTPRQYLYDDEVDFRELNDVLDGLYCLIRSAIDHPE